MAEPVKVAQRSALADGKPRAVSVGEQSIALFLVDGAVVATAGKCPHAGGPLHKGSVCDGKLSCPWHGWTYDLTTGECDESDEITLQRFEVRVEGDDVWVVV